MDFADREETVIARGAAVGRRPLGALLIEAGIASEDEIQDALDECIRTRERLAEVVLRRGWISERKLARLLADQNPGDASVKKAPSPVDLVGAWLRLTNYGSQLVEETHGRDVPDEAPLDDVNFEEEPVETTDELHGETPRDGHAPTDQTFPLTGSVIERLHALTTEVLTLEHELAERRRRLDAQQTELAELRQAHASDLDTISSLGAGLEERRRRLDALRAVVGDLAVELDQ
jgi:hypothetical protein